jgi:hypothetical protein
VRNPVPVLTPPVSGLLVSAEVEIEDVETDYLAGRDTDQAAGTIAPKSPDLFGIGAGILKPVWRCRRLARI